jgi:CRP-like cAMP-binding protein
MSKSRRSFPVNIYSCPSSIGWLNIVRLGRSTEEEIRTLGRGDYFGEQSLIKEDKRSANIIAMSPGVECLTLDRDSFKQHIGDLEELHEKDYGDRDRIYAIKQTEYRQTQLFNQEREVERGELVEQLNLINGNSRFVAVFN